MQPPRKGSPPPRIFSLAAARGEMRADKMRSRYGDITLGELAQRVAEQGDCALAGGDEFQCDAEVVEPPIEIWGRLRDAERHGMRPVLVCQRRYYALKRVKSCPPVEMDLPTLFGALGSDYPLDRLSAKVKAFMLPKSR
ncbi:MAG: hypothetical protein CML24_11330 [Rhizobiales bacterium]|nr:hypothetical protein [Hyphomicrobiales bacterium]